MSNKPILVITGPTAVGKTRLAVAVANDLHAEIINADSRQVYRKMDIGTGKDLADYKIGGKKVPFHLIDICEPGYKYNIKEYQQDFNTIYQDLIDKGRQIVLCGGSGLYIESALEGNPYAFIPVNNKIRNELADESNSLIRKRIASPVRDKLNITTLTTTKRLIRAVEISEYLRSNKDLPEHRPYEALIYVLTLERKLVKERILNRLQARLDKGMIEEVQRLLDSGITPEQLLYYGLEYRWITMYLLQEMSYDEMFDRLNISIRQFAKRQMTWFRRMEKKGYKLNWLDGNIPFEDLREQVVMEFTNKQGI